MSVLKCLRKSIWLRTIHKKVVDAKYSFATIISPKLNTKMRYKAAFGKRLDLLNPQTLNDKVLWLKLNYYWKNPLIKQCADKYKVREYIEQIGCPEILNVLIAVYERPEDIEWDKLPKSFAMKLNVGCGYNIIVPDKATLDVKLVVQQLKKWMREKYYLAYSEMQYKDVKPYIIVEKYLYSKSGSLPEDFKFYCFNGEVPYVMVCTDRQEGGGHSKFWYYDSDWKLQMMTSDALKYGLSAAIEKPDGIDKAFEYARKLSEGFPFVRVDLFIIDGKVIFGEYTFTPSAGLDSGRLKEVDELLGDYVILPTN